MGLRLLLSVRVFASMHQVLGLILGNPTKINKKDSHLGKGLWRYGLLAQKTVLVYTGSTKVYKATQGGTCSHLQ